MRFDWRSLAPACGAPDCPVHRLVQQRTCCSREIAEGTAAIIDRTVWCAPNYSVSQQRLRQWLAARSAGDAWPEPTVTRPHQTVRCAKGTEGSTVGCNALNLGVEFFLLFSHQIQALPFSFLVPSLNLDLFQSYSGVWLGIPV
jgi:hypothetical protein